MKIVNTFGFVKVAIICASFFITPLSTYAQSDDPTLSTQAAAAKHTTYHLDTWKQIVHKWRMLGKTGMRLKDLEVLEHTNGKRVYIGAWEPGSGKHALYRYSSWSAFVDKWEELNPQGYRLIDIERVRHGNKFWYYGVWRAGTGKYGLYKYSSWKDFTEKWSELNGKGYRLIDIDVTEHNNVTTYVGVWRSGTGKYALFNYGEWSSLVNKWRELGPLGYQMSDMDIVRRSDGTSRYVGVWTEGSTKRALYRYKSWKSFKTKWADLAEKGYALLDVEVAQANATGTWYIGSFGPAPNALSGGPDLEKMAQYLEDNLGDDVVGMSYAISENGQLAIAGSTGLAQRSPDGEIPMSSHIRSTVASVSKAITAPLLYRLLDANGLTIDAPISPWLPASWSKGPGFVDNANGVTFRHLLTHTAGLNQEFKALKAANQSDPWGNGWDGLEFIVNNGTQPDSTREYKNADYALLRVLIPALWRTVGGPDENVTKENAGQHLLDYLHQLVLDKEAISSVTCWPQAGYPEAKSYDFDNMSLQGKSWSSSLDGCGGHANLHFSAQELTQYSMAVRFDDSIMTPSDRTFMQDNLAGWSRANNVSDGIAYSHGGSYTSGGRDTRTCIMELPHSINASIIVNSLPPSSACGSLRQAYNAAF